MQKMINLTLAMDVVFILTAFLILFFDKTNATAKFSKNIKSYLYNRKHEVLGTKTALFFIDIVISTGFLVALHYIWGFSNVNIAILALLTLVLISAIVIFPILFLKTIGLAKRITNRSLSSTH